MKSASPVIIVGLDCITGLQTARILADRGVPVIGIVQDSKHFCNRTRVCERIIACDFSADALLPVLENIAQTLTLPAVLCPCTDGAVLLLSEHRDSLHRNYLLALPSPEVLRTLMDKALFFHFATEHEIAIPRTFLLRNSTDARAAAAQLNYPCVLKPPLKSALWQQNTKTKAYKVAGASELLALYERCSGWSDLLIAQEWVAGGDDHLYSCNCYFSTEGKALAPFIARKIRQWPPETGTSCLGEEVRNDEVLEESLKIFRRVGYRGLGYVEMKRDENSGRHYVLELNIGRPTGRSAIAEAGGVELLYSMYCDLTGLPLPEQREQTYTGVKWIYWRNDLRSAWHYWRKGDISLSQIWQSWRGRKACAVFSWRDPGPFLADLWRSLWMSLSRGRGGQHDSARQQPLDDQEARQADSANPGDVTRHHG